MKTDAASTSNGKTDFEFRPANTASNNSTSSPASARSTGSAANASGSQTRSKSPSAIINRFTNFARGKYRNSLSEKTSNTVVADDRLRRVSIICCFKSWPSPQTIAYATSILMQKIIEQNFYCFSNSLKMKAILPFHEFLLSLVERFFYFDIWQVLKTMSSKKNLNFLDTKSVNQACFSGLFCANQPILLLIAKITPKKPSKMSIEVAVSILCKMKWT